MASLAIAQEGKKTSQETVIDKSVAISTEIPSAREAMEKLKKWDEQLNSLKATFTQEVIFKNADIKKKINGSIAYKKPDNLKVEHVSPRKQLIITDRKKIFIYKPEDKIAYEADWEYWKKNLDNSLSSLIDFGNYSSLAEKNSSSIYVEGNLWVLELRSKKNPSAYLLKLFLSKEDFFPKKASLEVGDSVIMTELEDVSKNIEIKNDEFKRPSKVKVEKI